jgi:hypothetical protein
MSDMTSLSNEYNANADFAKQFNTAVLELKRDQFQVASVGEERPRLQEHRELIANMLKRLAQQFGDAETVIAGGGTIPADVAERLHSNHKSEMEWFLQDLNAATQALIDGGSLDERQWEVLDEICDVADAAASATFRRLWRR